MFWLTIGDRPALHLHSIEEIIIALCNSKETLPLDFLLYDEQPQADTCPVRCYFGDDQGVETRSFTTGERQFVSWEIAKRRPDLAAEGDKRAGRRDMRF